MLILRFIYQPNIRIGNGSFSKYKKTNARQLYEQYKFRIRASYLHEFSHLEHSSLKTKTKKVHLHAVSSSNLILILQRTRRILKKGKNDSS